jgi:hypothetical protein
MYGGVAGKAGDRLPMQIAFSIIRSPSTLSSFSPLTSAILGGLIRENSLSWVDEVPPIKSL